MRTCRFILLGIDAILAAKMLTWLLYGQGRALLLGTEVEDAVSSFAGVDTLYLLRGDSVRHERAAQLAGFNSHTALTGGPSQRILEAKRILLLVAMLLSSGVAGLAASAQAPSGSLAPIFDLHVHASAGSEDSPYDAVHDYDALLRSALAHLGDIDEVSREMLSQLADSVAAWVEADTVVLSFQRTE